MIEDKNKALPIIAVIITFCKGSTYDNLFREVKQLVQDARVQVYSTDFENIKVILNALQKGDQQNKLAAQFAKEIKEVEVDSVLFNWECCSGCQVSSNYGFNNKKDIMELIQFAITNKHMMMFSDFAVKGLLNDWDEKILGPLPFAKLGECSSFLKLHFIPNDLKECCSQQLQMVGQLSETGTSTIHALGGTVVFGLKEGYKESDSKNIYTLQILTTMTETSGFDVKSAKKEQLVNIKDNQGTIGHALLKYATGANLLLSAGHWVELKNLNVKVDNLEKIAQNNYGENNMFNDQINNIKNAQMAECEKQFCYEQIAQQFVKQSAPCKLSKKKC